MKKLLPLLLLLAALTPMVGCTGLFGQMVSPGNPDTLTQQAGLRNGEIGKRVKPVKPEEITDANAKEQAQALLEEIEADEK